MEVTRVQTFCIALKESQLQVLKILLRKVFRKTKPETERKCHKISSKDRSDAQCCTSTFLFKSMIFSDLEPPWKPVHPLWLSNGGTWQANHKTKFLLTCSKAAQAESNVEDIS